MLLVKTFLAKSKISGIGCFADQPISKGQVTWRRDHQWDIAFKPDYVGKLPDFQQEFIKHFGYFEKRHGLWIVCLDNCRFYNHSRKPNMVDHNPYEDRAARDIEAGEEITIDYTTFDGREEPFPFPL